MVASEDVSIISCAVLASAINATSALPFSDRLAAAADTVKVPATMLVSVTVTVPLSPVVPLASPLNTGPPLTVKLTAWFCSGLPPASVSVAVTVRVAVPFAAAVSSLSAATVRRAVLISAANLTCALTAVPLPRRALTAKVPATALVSGTSSSPLLSVLVLRVAALLLLNRGPSAGTLSVTLWTLVSGLPCASSTFSVTGCVSVPFAVFVSEDVSIISRAVLASAVNATSALPLSDRSVATPDTVKLPATVLVSVTVTVPLSSVVPLASPLNAGPPLTVKITAWFCSGLSPASVSVAVTVRVALPFAAAASPVSAVTVICAELISAANVTCALTAAALPRRALTVKVPATRLVSDTSSSPLLSVLVLRVAALLLNRGPSAGTLSVTLWTLVSGLPCASSTFSVTGCVAVPFAVFVSEDVSIISRAVLASAVNATSALPLSDRSVAVPDTVKVPAVMLVSATVTVPSLPVVPLASPLNAGPPSTVKLTAWFCSGLLFPSVSVAVTVRVAVPFAAAASPVSAVTVSCAELVSATNVTFTLWPLPLIDAVTVTSPATRLVSDIVMVPAPLVVPLAAIVAPLSALKFTTWSGKGVPRASVTVAFTRLVVSPSAHAPVSTTSSAPAAICAVPVSATNVTSTLSLLLLIDAVTVESPTTRLVSVMVTVPSLPVVPLAAIVAPLSALKLTLCPARIFPFASVTVAFTLLGVDPSASAPLITRSSAPSAICAVLASAINVTLTLRLLLLIDAVTVASPATRLVSVMVTVPSAPVVPLAAIVAPLFTLKFTT